MSENQTPKWISTSVQHLYRNRDSGRYYLRAFRDGKEVWRSLKTDVFTVAKLRLGKELATLGKAQKAAQALAKGKGEIRDAIAEYERKLADNVKIKPSTRHYRKQLIAVILKTWPELPRLRLTAITDSQCHSWAAKIVKEYSATRYNNTVDTLRQIFEVCIHFGLATHNPADHLQKITPKPKNLILPSGDEFKKIVEEIRGAEGAVSMGCADMVEFLAYSGCRKEEAASVRWADVDETRGTMWILKTKNGIPRNIPLIKPMRDLLQRMRDEPRAVRNKKRLEDGKVLSVG